MCERVCVCVCVCVCAHIPITHFHAWHTYEKNKKQGHLKQKVGLLNTWKDRHVTISNGRISIRRVLQVCSCVCVRVCAYVCVYACVCVWCERGARSPFATALSTSVFWIAGVCVCVCIRACECGCVCVCVREAPRSHFLQLYHYLSCAVGMCSCMRLHVCTYEWVCVCVGAEKGCVVSHNY